MASISIFGHFSVGNKQKHIKKFAFSNENTSVWAGENRNISVVETILHWLKRKRIFLKKH